MKKVFILMAIIFCILTLQCKTRVVNVEAPCFEDGKVYISNRSGEMIGYGNYLYTYQGEKYNVLSEWTWLYPGHSRMFSGFVGGVEVWLPYSSVLPSHLGGWKNTAHFIVDGDINIAINKGGSYSITE